MTAAPPLRLLAAVAALAACGRFGFAPPPDAAPDAPDAAVPLVTVILTTDEYGNEAAGLPIAGATVVVEHAAGPRDLLATDAAGTARFPAADVVATHVAFHSDLGWRVYTVAIGHAGTIELGGRRNLASTRQLAVTAPNNGGTAYAVRLPEHCAPTAGTASTPTVVVDYASA
jgi:hypothetical protein